MKESKDTVCLDNGFLVNNPPERCVQKMLFSKILYVDTSLKNVITCLAADKCTQNIAHYCIRYGEKDGEQCCTPKEDLAAPTF